MWVGGWVCRWGVAGCAGGVWLGMIANEAITKLEELHSQ